MAEVVKMPRLSDTMTVGTVAKWHANKGDAISEGDLLAEIETDKATMEFESFQEGTLLYIGVQEGEEAPVDSILAILGQEGEDVQSIIENFNSGSKDKSDSDSKADEPAEPAAEAPVKEEKKKEAPAAPQVTTSASSSTTGGRIKASPLAKKLAEEKGVDLNAVSGSGEGGRIVKRDIDNYQPSAAPATAVSAGPDFEDRNVSQMRKTIARRLSESKFTAPHFYLTVEINMSEAMRTRKAINDKGDVRVSFNDYVIKAAAMALTKHPYVNASWMEDKIRFNNRVNIGVAVAVEEGLLVPVVRDANVKGMAQISSEVRDFAGKARDKKLQPSDWEGNTFTISNLGMFGIEEFTAIINPPDSCILAVGSIIEKPVVVNGAIEVGHMMKVTLSCDHRVVDGAKGAEFLQTFKQFLENPVSMLV
jgi:pyruvate dehydrogenase E2 component (dihydrolipoamide acetyltransferase)